MSPRVTRASLSTLTLLTLAVLLGVVSGRAELFLASVPLALRLLAVTRSRVAPRYTLVHEVSATRLFEGEGVTLTLAMTAHTPLAQVEALASLPPSAELPSGAPRTVLVLAAGETRRWSHEVRFPERGHQRIGAVHVRVWEPSGLAVSEAVHVEASTVQVYPRAAPLRRLPSPRRTRASVGNYVSTLVGDGIEPGEIRPFAPGDRIKHVNWRASLRLDRLYVTRHLQERNADVVLMLDTLSQVGVGSATTLDASLRAAASLAAAYVARRDRVGLIEYGGVLRWVRPGEGRHHLERLLATLVRAEVVFTYVTRDLGLVPPGILPPAALVLALSPLLDARFTAALTDLAGRGFDLVVVAVDPVSATRAALPPSLRVDTACRLWTLERRVHMAALAARGLRVVEWRPEEPIEMALTQIVRRPHPRVLAG